MNKQLKLASGMVFLGLMALVGTVPALAAQPSNPVQVALALAAAQNANDPAAMRALIAPDATFVNAPETGGDVQGREAWIAGNTGADNSHVNVTNAQQTGPDTVSADAVLSGGDIPPLPHPFTIHVEFTVTNGLISHGVITLSPQTHQDVAAVRSQPGMPTTGQPVGWFLPGLLGLLALALGLGGLAMRSRRHAR